MVLIKGPLAGGSCMVPLLHDIPFGGGHKNNTLLSPSSLAWVSRLAPQTEALERPCRQPRHRRRRVSACADPSFACNRPAVASHANCRVRSDVVAHLHSIDPTLASSPSSHSWRPGGPMATPGTPTPARVAPRWRRCRRGRSSRCTRSSERCDRWEPQSRATPPSSTASRHYF